MLRTLKLTPDQWGEMYQHVESQAPLEACGLLAGKENRVEKVIIVRNAERSPVRFRMDPQEQYNAFDWIDVHSLELVGIFHSHPTGPETASPTDIAEAAYDVVHVIWFRKKQAWNARGFCIQKGKVREVDLQVIAG